MSMKNHQVIEDDRGFTNVFTETMEWVGTVARHPETQEWCLVKMVYGYDKFPSRNLAIKKLLGGTDEKEGKEGKPAPSKAESNLAPNNGAVSSGEVMQTKETKDTYSQKATAVRAAKRELGGDAIEGTDFVIKAVEPRIAGFKWRRARETKAGVVSTIELCLRKAGTTKKPVTKEQVLKVLAKTFPERPVEGMENTFRTTPGYLKKRGCKVVIEKETGKPKRYFIAA